MTNEQIAELFVEDEDIIQCAADLADEICEIVEEMDNFTKTIKEVHHGT